jgi:hypothetical protein
VARRSISFLMCSEVCADAYFRFSTIESAPPLNYYPWINIIVKQIAATIDPVINITRKMLFTHIAKQWTPYTLRQAASTINVDVGADEPDAVKNSRPG